MLFDRYRFLRAPADEGSAGGGAAADAGGGAGGDKGAGAGAGGTGKGADASAGAAPAAGGGTQPAGGAASDAAGARAVPDWAKSLDADTQALIVDKGWQDPGAAMKSYRDLEAVIGDKRLAPPPENASDEQWSGWAGWEKLGRPESWDKYDLDGVVPAADDPAAFDGDALEAFKKIAHAEGVPARTLRKLVGAYSEFASGTIKAFNERTAKASAALQREWGADYQPRVDQSIVTFNAWRDQVLGDGNHEAKKALDEAIIVSGLGSNPYFIQMMHALGDQILEEGQLHGVVNGSRMSAVTAQARLAKMDADPELKKAALHNDHPQHEAVMAERIRLNQIIKGETR